MSSSHHNFGAGPALIVAISRLAARSDDDSDFLEGVADLLLKSAEFDEVVITLQVGLRGQALSVAASREATNKAISFSFSRDLIVRGKCFGHIQLRSCRKDPSLLPQVADCVAQQLALFAELQSERALHQALRKEIEDTVHRLKTMKLVAHATAILAAKREMSEQAAMHWLRTESRKTRKPLWQFAEQFIEHYKSQDREGLRRIA